MARLQKIINRSKKSQLVEIEEHRKDLGFGSSLVNDRLINPDGTFNSERKSTSFWAQFDIFYWLTTMRWSWFFAVIFLTYFTINCLFSLVYLAVGIENLAGIQSTDSTDQFWESFFFSAQTLTTVGYGHVSPKGNIASAVASLEALVGLLGFALATGLVYSRFSRPKSHILFSKNALISPYLDINAFMFRIVNEGANELIDIHAELSLSRIEKNASGDFMRKYYNLKLERNHVNLFPLSWTLVHPITEDSPIYGHTLQDMIDSNSEFLIYIRATEETFLQPIQTRYSYKFSEVVWGAKFKPMFDSTQTQGVVRINVDDVHIYNEKPLN